MLKIEEGISFRDSEGRVIIIVDSEDAVKYIRNLYKENITKLILIHKEVSDYGDSIDFKNKDTKLVIENVLIKEQS